MNINEFLKSKTVWAGVAALCTAAEGFFTGNMELSPALQLAFTGILGIFLRQGIAKK